MFNSPSNAQEVAKLPKLLQNRTDYGLDRISNETLKCCPPIAEPILDKTFNDGIQKSTYPTWLKLAKITPSFKQGDGSWQENYRPIRLISSPSKVF